jgi:hypothetical protein
LDLSCVYIYQVAIYYSQVSWDLAQTYYYLKPPQLADKQAAEKQSGNCWRRASPRGRTPRRLLATMAKGRACPFIWLAFASPTGVMRRLAGTSPR